VDCDAFRTGRALAGFMDGSKNILSIARLEPRNGVDAIVDAFARLAVERSDVRLLLAGDGPCRGVYEAQVAALPERVRRRIVFLGPVWEERADLYATAHCFVLAARKASFSILMLEALAAGLPVAALPAEGPATWRGSHWSLAHIAHAQSAAALADALRRALQPSPPGYVEMAHALAQRYAWTEIVPRIKQVYADAMAAHGRVMETA